MKGELVSFETSDKLILPGFFVKRNKKCIIFVHGLMSSFLTSNISKMLYREIPKLGYNLLLFNNRGSGIVSGVHAKNKDSWLICGGAHEKFEDCAKDIQAAVNFAKRNGCKEIFLVGHSTGCQKSAYYMSGNPDKSVKGLILLAPGNDTEGFIIKFGKKKFLSFFNKSKQLVKKGKGDSLVGLLSAKRFYSLHKKGSTEGNMFNYETGEMKRLSKIKIPVLAVFGSKDESSYNPKKELELIEKNIRSECKSSVIEGAEHGFEGYEDKLMKIIKKWLADLNGKQK